MEPERGHRPDDAVAVAGEAKGWGGDGLWWVGKHRPGCGREFWLWSLVWGVRLQSLGYGVGFLLSLGATFGQEHWDIASGRGGTPSAGASSSGVLRVLDSQRYPS